MLVKDYQEYEGAKDDYTLYVEYEFDETASGGELVRGMRTEWVRYPNGRKVFFDYDASSSDAGGPDTFPQ